MGEVELKRIEDLFFGHKEFGVLIYTAVSLSSNRGAGGWETERGAAWEVSRAHPTAHGQPNLICSHFDFLGAQ